MLNKALFLDRDGVINKDVGYAHKVSDICFIKDIFNLTRLAQSNNFLIIVITNQAGIGRGKYTEEDFLNLTFWIDERFLENGVGISATFYCPHHPDHGIGRYKKKCRCRKPGSMLFHRAKKKFNIDMGSSVMIGDKISDIKAANKAGIKKLFLYSQENVQYQKLDFELISSLKSASKIFLK